LYPNYEVPIVGESAFEGLKRFRDWFEKRLVADDFEKKHTNLRYTLLFSMLYFYYTIIYLLISQNALFRGKIHLRNDFPEGDVEGAYLRPMINSSNERFSWAPINISEVIYLFS
jgi:hypothetical protein